MAQSIQKVRFNEVDIYKGIAILLIIYGHCFCSFPIDLKGEIGSIQVYIAKFNLNMFFVISGVLFTFKDTWKEFLVKKWKRLVLPWLVFVVLTIAMRIVAGSITNNHVQSFPHELFLAITTAKYYWFLYALFIMMVFTKALKNKWFVLSAALVGVGLYLSGFKSSWNLLMVNRFIMYYPWFATGVLIKSHYKDILTYVCKYLNLAVVVSIFVFIASIVANSLLGQTYISNMIISIMACSSLWVLSVFIAIKLPKERLLTHFGMYSLQYYLNHLLILLPCFYVGAYAFEISPYLSLLVIFALGVLFSFIMLKIEERFPLLRMLCGLPELKY